MDSSLAIPATPGSMLPIFSNQWGSPLRKKTLTTLVLVPWKAIAHRPGDQGVATLSLMKGCGRASALQQSSVRMHREACDNCKMKFLVPRPVCLSSELEHIALCPCWDPRKWGALLVKIIKSKGTSRRYRAQWMVMSRITDNKVISVFSVCAKRRN